MPIGSSLGITLPTPGVTTDWGDEVNEAFESLIEAVEGQVPSSALDITSNLVFGGNDITQMGTIQFTNESAGLTAAGDVRKAYAVGGDLYFTDGSQNAIQITSGGALNASALGGISGAGYGSSGVQISWDATNYNFKDGSGSDDYAPGRFDVIKLNDGSGNFLTLDAPSLASDYTITLPTAVPAAAALVQSDTSGTLTFSNTLTQAITATDFKHSTAQSLVIPPASAIVEAGSTWRYSFSNFYWDIPSNGDQMAFPIELRSGDRITGVSAYITDTSGSKTMSMKLRKLTSTGTLSQIGSTQTSAGDGSAQTLALTGLTETLSTTTFYQVELSCNAASAVSHAVRGVIVTFDRP